MGFVRGVSPFSSEGSADSQNVGNGNGNSKRPTGHSRTLSWYIKLGFGRLMSVPSRAEGALPSLHSANSAEASRQSCRRHSPDSVLSHYFERRRVSDQLVQSADEVGEARPC